MVACLSLPRGQLTFFGFGSGFRAPSRFPFEYGLKQYTAICFKSLPEGDVGVYAFLFK